MSNDTRIPLVYAGEVLAAAIVLPVVGILIVGLRLWVRRVLEQGLGGDDWTISAALFFVIGMGATLIWGVARKSVGYPSTPYPVPKTSYSIEELTELTPQQKVVETAYWIIWLLMILANGLIKLSAILLYRRIFVVNRWSFFDVVTKVMFVICFLWTAGFGLAQIFGCGRHFWRPFGTLADVASCNTNVRLNGLMTSDLITDILVWLLPLLVIWRLPMKLSQKLSVTALMLLAAMSVVAAIIRLMIEIEIANGGYDSDIDTDLVLTSNMYWTMIESGLALIAACLPVTCVPAARIVIHGRLNLAMRSMRNASSLQSEVEVIQNDSGDKGLISHIDESRGQTLTMPQSTTDRNDSQIERNVQSSSLYDGGVA